ncbi:hypothetical protein [Streptomyces sp. NBC_00239]|uniref:hypothetical protein n=1 Tax=Streptomyces sp. NBC_00239 TaxID=2903640 RepID=UPI002E2CD68B|nr:hypothetical protein [Streptomyces sp. NBC_00239]
MTVIKIGDRVQGPYVLGVVTDVDPDDSHMPYYVQWDGNDYGLWVREGSVRPIAVAAPSDREALVARAKELLADTHHTGADVVAMAAFLAGEPGPASS